MWTSSLHTVLSYNSSDVKLWHVFYSINLKPEVASLLHMFMIKAIRHFYRDIGILLYSKHHVILTTVRETIHQLMCARLKNEDVLKTIRICSKISLVHLWYRQITFVFEKQTLFCTAFFSWCHVPAVTVNWHIKANSWQNIKLNSILAWYRHLHE